jgi:ribonuclease R
MERKFPFVYRIHDEPSMQALERFQKLAATVGVKFIPGKATPRQMTEMLRKLEGHPAQTMLNMALLRSMRQAIYSSGWGIHYGLASQGYTHFTSPIRRYPDLVVHRLLRRIVRSESGVEPKVTDRERADLEEMLADITEHCSYRERLASEAERESIKLKQVRIMMRHLGDEFDGVVSGLTESGLFIRIDDPFLEGFVSKDSMTDDFYQFNEDRMVFYGTRKKRTFRVGDKVRINVVRADLDTRQVDFGLLDGGNAKSGMDFGLLGREATDKANRKRDERDQKFGARGGRSGRSGEGRSDRSSGSRPGPGSGGGKPNGGGAKPGSGASKSGSGGKRRGRRGGRK